MELPPVRLLLYLCQGDRIVAGSRVLEARGFWKE